ncbi:GlcG/HbpS family heme-binding protein [Brucellaceae bacterium D45D]
MHQLTLERANAIIAGALTTAENQKLKPLAVSVFDAGGNLKAFQRQDGTSILRFEIASGKAFGALAVGAGSRWLHNQAKDRPHFLEGLSGVSGGRIVPVPGGVLIKNKEGEILGAVGISGDTSDNDEAAAIDGIEKAGFVADAG